MQDIRKCNIHPVIFEIWKTIPHLQANPYRLETKNINSLIFISTVIK